MRWLIDFRSLSLVAGTVRRNGQLLDPSGSVPTTWFVTEAVFVQIIPICMTIVHGNLLSSLYTVGHQYTPLFAQPYEPLVAGNTNKRLAGVFETAIKLTLCRSLDGVLENSQVD